MSYPICGSKEKERRNREIERNVWNNRNVAVYDTSVSRSHPHVSVRLYVYLPHLAIIRRCLSDRLPCRNWTSRSGGNTWVCDLYRIIYMCLPLS